MSDSLARHLIPAPEGGRTHLEVRARIDGHLKALDVPFTTDVDGDFVVPSKHGDAHIFLTDDGEAVVFSVLLGTVENNPKKKAEFFRILLQVNSGLTPAHVCLIGEDHDRQLLMFCRAATKASTLGKEDLEWTLQSVLDQAAWFSKE